ncbi:hypothetical protein D3C72_1911480 [compost metagenome]
MHIIIYKKAIQHGKVSSTGDNVGGLIGNVHAYNLTTSSYIQYSYVIIQNSYAKGEVSGGSNVGGLVRIFI